MSERNLAQTLAATPARTAAPARPAGLRGPLGATPANDTEPGLAFAVPGAAPLAAVPTLGPGIHDDDAARAFVTRLLIDELAPLLGIDPTRIVIRADEDAAQRLDARHASGLQRGDTILLHPERYRPQTPGGRYLLAHEAAHVAQRKAPVPAGLATAEGEADRIARSFARGRTIDRPRAALADGVAAAFEGPDPDKAFDSLLRENHADELDRIRSALSYGVFDWAITDDDVSDVLRILEPLAYSTQVALIGALDDNFRRHLADNISPVHFKRYRASILAAYDAISQRSPGDLPDNPFDGMDFSGIAPVEHYALYRILPAFKSTGKGKAWFARHDQGVMKERLAEILGTAPTFDVVKDRKDAFEAEQARKQEREEDKKNVALTDVAKFLADAREKLTYHALDWAITDSEALSLLDDVTAFLNEPPKLRAIVDTLEDDGLMDRWVDNIPVDALYTDVAKIAGGKTINRRSAFLRVLALRPPWKNSRKAEELLSRGLLDWAITDEDAFLAFQLVKSLPEQVRAGFYADQGGKYASRLDDQMSLSMRKGLSANFYTGGKDGGDLQSIKAQLLDDTVWTAAQMSRLRVLIQMARAAGEARWVFEQSRSRYQGSAALRELYGDSDFFKQVVQAFKLYVPKGFVRPDGTVDAKGREDYEPEEVRGHSFGSGLVSLFRAVGFLFSHTGRIQIFKESVGGEGFDFNEIQALTGGDLAGVEFAKPSDVLDANTDELTDNVVRWDLDQGVLEMRAALLAIEAVNYPLANLKIQTGAIRIHNLNLHLEYPEKDSKRDTTSLRLRIDRLDIDDMLLIRPDSMTGFEHISVSELRVDLLPNRPAAQISAPDESYAIGTFLLSPLYNVFKISGLSLGPLTIAESRTGHLTERTEEAQTPLDLTATAGGIMVKGLTRSSGQFVREISLQNVVARTRNPRNKERYRDGLVKERDRLWARIHELREPHGPLPTPASPYVTFDTVASLIRELNSVEGEIKTLDDTEADRRSLEDKAAAGPLSAEEQQRLDRDKQYLAGIDRGGIALDVGHTEVKGIAGQVSMGDLSLDDIHAYGSSPGAALGMFVDSTTVNRMLRGPEYLGTLAGVEKDSKAFAFAKLGDLELNAINVQGDIPTVEAAEKEYAEAQKRARAAPFDPSLDDLVERLRLRRDNATVYWRLIRKPDIDTNDRAEFNRARNALLADKALHIDQLTATGATLGISDIAPGTLGVGLSATSLAAHGVETRALEVKDIIGRNVQVSAAGGGLDALIGLGKNRSKTAAAATVSADELRLAGISHKYSGVKVDEVVVDSLKASGRAASGTDSSVGIAAGKITVTGVSWALSQRVLEYQWAKLTSKPADQLTKAETAQVKDIEALLDTLQTSKDSLAEAAQHLIDPALSPDEKRRWEAQKQDAEDQLAFWQKKVELKRLTVSDLGVDITGLGDVLAEDFDLDAALKHGITVTGQGPDKQITSGVTAEGAWMRLSAGGTKDTPKGTEVTAGSQAGVEELRTGPIRGSITYADDHISLDGFQIGFVSLRSFHYTGGNTAVWSDGTSRVETLSLTARIETPLVDDKAADGDRHVTLVHIDHFGIGKLTGQNIHYRNYASGLRATLTAGSLIDVHADGVDVDFGNTESDPLLIKGGTAGFAKAEGLRAVATTAGGLSVAGMLNTQALAAHFADDGTITADLHQIEADAHITQKDLDTRINARARNLHLELLPGAKGYSDATQRFRLEGGQIKASGRIGKVSDTGADPDPTRFAANVTDLNTGDIERTPDGTIKAPDIGIGEVALKQFHFDNTKMSIDVPQGADVLLTAVQANITAEANPKPEDQRGKDELPFSRIVVHDFYIPIVTLHEMSIALHHPDKGDLIVSLPHNRISWMKELRVRPEKGSDGFVIKPNDGWQMFGRLGVDEMHFQGVGADLRSALIGSVNADVTNFTVGFFGAAETTFGFDDLVAQFLDGRLKEPGKETATADPAGATIVSKLKRAGFTLNWSQWTNAPKAHAHGFKYSTKTGATLEELDISGLRYEDPDLGLKLDIAKAVLPTGKDGKPAFEYTSAGKIIIPTAEIDDAAFTVADVMKLAAGNGKPDAKAKDDGLSYTPDLKALELLSGHVNFTVEPFVRTGVSVKQTAASLLVDGTYHVRINIQRGGQLSVAVNNLARVGAEIKVENGQVYMKSGGGVRLWPGSVNIKVKSLDPDMKGLSGREAELARSGFVNVKTLFAGGKDGGSDKDDDDKPSGSFLSSFFFGDLDIHLELPGSGTINLGNAGSLTLGGRDSPGFVLDVTSSTVPAIKAAVPKLTANIASLNLKLDTAGTTLKTGSIKIDGVRDTTLHFENGGVGPVYTDDDGHKTQNELPMPSMLYGTLTKATVQDIEVQTAPDKKAGP